MNVVVRAAVVVLERHQKGNETQGRRPNRTSEWGQGTYVQAATISGVIRHDEVVADIVHRRYSRGILAIANISDVRETIPACEGAGKENGQALAGHYTS